jgi:hypothetical protein
MTFRTKWPPKIKGSLATPKLNRFPSPNFLFVFFLEPFVLLLLLIKSVLRELKLRRDPQFDIMDCERQKEGNLTDRRRTDFCPDLLRGQTKRLCAGNISARPNRRNRSPNRWQLILRPATPLSSWIF